MSKVCSKCRVDKPISDFGRLSKSKDGLGHRCKQCSRDLGKNQYANKKDECLERSKNRCSEILPVNTNLLNVYKREKGCRYCPENDPIALDMHHRDPDEKKFGIASRIGDTRWVVLIKEIEKCDVICSNCHRKLHAGRHLVVLQ